MLIFREDGHLSGAVLETLAQQSELGLLERLEISEHLAYCDFCLQRYTEALMKAALLVPEHSCRKSLRHRMYRQTIQIFTRRYAAAAAAVALALTMLWSNKLPSLFQSFSDKSPPPISETVDSALESFSSSLRNTLISTRGFSAHAKEIFPHETK